MPTRKAILERLARGEIDVTEAADLLGQPQAVESAAPEPVKPPPGPTEPEPSATPEPPAEPQAPSAPDAPQVPGRRWLHIHVSDLDTGRNRVRVNVPLSLVTFGLKVGARVTDEIDSEMIQDIMGTLQNDDVTGTLIEVEDIDDNERVHIFVD